MNDEILQKVDESLVNSKIRSNKKKQKDNEEQLLEWRWAYALSLSWTLVFITVFLMVTGITSAKTPAIVFFFGLWISIIAEAGIRYLEGRVSQNDYYKGVEAIYLIIVGLFLFFFALFAVSMFNMDFKSAEFQLSWKGFIGPYESSCSVNGENCTEVTGPFWRDMFANWLSVISKKRFFLCLIACVVMRACIYRYAIKPNSSN